MPDAFISYSRKDSDFVHKLNDALSKVHRDVWVDWADIGRGADWWHEIQMGIDSADTALIIISEHWLISAVCHRELAYVRQQNKRVFPIIRQRIEDEVAIRVKGTWVDQEWEQQARDNWKYLRSVNWLFFDDDTRFDSVVQDLISALDTDQAYVKSHTRYLVRAMEWQQSHRNPSFLLEGDQVTAAADWLKSSVGKTPEPHQMHHEYVRASEIAEAARIARDKAREGLIKRFRQTAAGMGAAVVLAIIVAVLAGQQFLSARAEVTRAGATLQQVNLQVTGAINQQATAAAKAQAAEELVGTATVEQGNAVQAQQTSVAREAAAKQEVEVIGATLSPVPPTLTAVAASIQDATTQQEIAIEIANASLQLTNNDISGAVDTLNSMVADNQDEALAYVGRGSILESIGRQDEALQDYSKAIELDPERTDAYVSRGRILGDRGKIAESLADFSQAIANEPTYPDSYMYRGQNYYTDADYEKAIQDYTTVMSLQPDNANVYVLRAMAYIAQGKGQEALADYWSYAQKIERQTTTSDVVTPAMRPVDVTMTMTAGATYRILFEAKAGEQVRAAAVEQPDSAVDTLLFILDPQGKPLAFNDEQDVESTNALLVMDHLPVDGVYTLVVTYSVNGSEGDVRVTMKFGSSVPGITPTPQ